MPADEDDLRDESNDELEPFAESEEDLGDIQTPATFDAVVVSTDWTAETVLRQIARANIELDPEFQRRDAWTRVKKSRFIESLIVGLPVPQVVLAERKGRKGNFIVLDGKQRLLALQQFASGGFRLSGLDLRPDLNRKGMDDLPEEERLALETQTIRTVVVRNWQRDEFLYVVFLRLNTTSVPLSPQELRQALHPGPFVRFVNNFTAENSEFPRLYKRDQPDFRMRDVEILVRYFAFTRYLPQYVGNLSPLLDVTCKTLNEEWDSTSSSIRRDAQQCRQAIAAAYDVFGDNAFRRWNRERYETAFNRAVFDIMTFYGRDRSVRDAMLREPKEVEETFRSLCQDEQFSASLTTTTKSIYAIVTRLREWGYALGQVLDLDLPCPSIDGSGRIAYASI